MTMKEIWEYPKCVFSKTAIETIGMEKGERAQSITQLLKEECMEIKKEMLQMKKNEKK